MSRSKNKCCYHFKSPFKLFKPVGCRFCGVIELTAKELTALKLYNVDDEDQTSAAKHMGVSQPTFARIIRKAHQKISKALIEGKSIQLGDESTVDQPTS